MITLQFKIGTQPLIRHEVYFIPTVGSRVHNFPFPTGGRFTIRITDILRKEPVEESLFYGEWL